jgi:hypothetical protein
MAKKTSESPFQALEEAAYHAYREWPLWLVLRERELAAHLTASPPPHAATGPQNSHAAAAPTSPIKGA